MISRSLLFYFSATNVTHTYVKIQEKFLNQGCAVQAFNVDARSSRQNPLAFEAFNGVIFRFLSLSDFAPRRGE